jgi:hypothetical protein
MASALDHVESSVALLREAGFRGLALHWTGSVPFAFALLLFWTTITGRRVSDVACAAAALCMTALLVWMNCWRAAFAIRLRRRLNGDLAHTAAAAANIFRNQAAAAGWKLVLLPLAAVAMLPLAWTVAFFRGLAACSDLRPPDALSRARKLAGFEAKANWTGLGILLLLGLAVFVNVAVAMVMLPQLVKALTGYESTFARAGGHFVLNRLFFLAAGTITWLAIDPLVQAFYCVHCFRAESRETGADLRARLRALRAAARTSAALVFLAVCAVPAANAVTAPDLDRSIGRTLQAREYDWRLPDDKAAGRRQSWFVAATDRLVEEARRLLRTIGRLLDRLIRWLLARPSAPLPEAAPPRGGLTRGVGALIALAAIALVVLLRFGLRRRAAAAGPPPPRAAIDLQDETLTADRLPEDEWCRLAEECLGRGDFRAALRALYLGNLAWLHALELIALHPGKTNREYEREMRRRARTTAGAPPLLTANIDAFERSWYGRHAAAAADVGQFRDRLRRMKELCAP